MAANFFPVAVSDTKLSSFHGKQVSEATKIITEFLKWAEREKGLQLCEPYKPQYDWFIPILYRTKDLAAEFCALQGPKAYNSA
ncbi:MAG: hypothetical protein ACYCY1_09105 [Sulfuriferula sp.]